MLVSDALRVEGLYLGFAQESCCRRLNFFSVLIFKQYKTIDYCLSL